MTKDDDLLRRDVRLLGDMLGRVITDLAGDDAFQLVEQIRLLSRQRRAGAPEAEGLLAAKIAELDYDSARTVARAFSIFFDLANISEDRQRVRVLRARKERDPAPLSESPGAAIGELKRRGFTTVAVQQALDALSIELVFTAHPSEAKRRSIRGKLRRMRHQLQEYDRADLVPRERRTLETQLLAELAVLWQTEFLRPVRPTVLEEVERGLSIMPRLWEVVPGVYQAMRRALAEHYPDHTFHVPVFLRFGSWMGGDRDGNPNVTTEVTARTLCRLRSAAIDHHLAIARRMYDYLTVSLEADPGAAEFGARVDAAISRWPALEEKLADVAPREVYRRWIRVIEFRLEQSRTANIEAPALAGNYFDPEEFTADIAAIVERLAATGDRLGLDIEAQRWLDLARAFGLHLTRLDIRQDSRRYLEVMHEVLAAAGVVDDFMALDEPARVAALAQSMGSVPAFAIAKLSPLAHDTLELYRLLQRASVRFGAIALGDNVISLTQAASDVFSVLWLWRWAQAEAERRGEPRARAI